MFGHRKTEAENEARRQEVLTAYRTRLDDARAIADVGERYKALRKLQRDIRRKSIRPRLTTLKSLFMKYGMAVLGPPLITTVTLLLMPVIGYAAFAVSMAIAWAGSISTINKAERPADKVPYRKFLAARAAAVAPFRALRREIAAEAKAAVESAQAAQVATSSRRRLLLRHFPALREKLAAHFSGAAQAAKSPAKAKQSPPDHGPVI